MLNLTEKYLKKLNSDVSGKALAKNYGDGTSTVSVIKNNKDKIMAIRTILFPLFNE